MRITDRPAHTQIFQHADQKPAACSLLQAGVLHVSASSDANATVSKLATLYLEW